ncbi:MAG: transglycosylase SLT domain-containing protein [Nanoarchaeota archaeon]|nr:transglycosylase SLT domain-containing protein [Nanoarchaeota archaeon]
MCQKGQDFILQIAPGGCTPPVVRSDLLEEQDVPIFCKVQAMKINPAVNIKSIDSISFGSEYPRDVRTIDFFPSYSALGLDRQLSNLRWNDIGYAVIFLRANSNESSMPDFVEGNLSARIRYNAYDAFGSVDRTVYLPLIKDQEFEYNQGQYAFFNNMGYLRADSIGADSASISIYSGINANYLSGPNNQKQRVLGYNLDVGESSPNFFLPGFGCFASSILRLDNVEGQDTKAVIRVDAGEVSELKKGENFLNGVCRLTSDPVRQGLRETVDISCRADDGGKSFTLRIEPTVKLNIEGVEGNYQVGDYLYTELDENIYLGYVGTDDKKGEPTLQNSLIFLVSVPGPKMNKLDSTTLDRVGRVAEDSLRKDRSISDAAKTVFGFLATAWNWLEDSNNFERINFGEPRLVFGKTVNIESFGVGTNLAFNNATLNGYYGSAVSDYERIKNNFAGERYPIGDNRTLDERAMAQLISLSSILQQNEDLKRYCDDFDARYPDSTLDTTPCRGIPKYFNVGVSTQSILIGGSYREISFEGIRIPTIDEYGIELTIRRENKVKGVQMIKNDLVYLGVLFNLSDEGNTEYIKLNEILDETHASIDFHLENKSILAQTGDILSSRASRLTLNEPYNIGGTAYTFVINRINLDKVAKVSVHTQIRDTSTADFKFKVGIEKRSIKLSPDQIRSQIETFTALTNRLKSISDSLGTVVDVYQTACQSVGAILAVKNLIFNSGTESVARNYVMRGEGGWNERCSTLRVRGNVYSTQEECLLDNSGLIEEEVSQVSSIMEQQNNQFSQLESLPGVTSSGGLFGEDLVDQNALIEMGYSEAVISSLPSSLSDPQGTHPNIDMQKIHTALSPEGFKSNIYSLDEAREIELYAKLYEENPQNIHYQTKLYSLLYGLQTNKNADIVSTTWSGSMQGVSPNQIGVLTSQGSRALNYLGLTLQNTGVSIGGVDSSTPIYLAQTETGGQYILLLDDSAGTDTYTIRRDSENRIMVFDSSGTRVSDESALSVFNNVYFKKIDISENTPITNPEIKYYETDPFKGLPAVVPVRPEKGWYVYITQPTPTITTSVINPSSGGYDASARVNSFWICNAGSNGIMEYNPMNDMCQFVILGNSNTYTSIGSLTTNEAVNLINNAVSAIETASRAYQNGVQNVRINGVTYGVGAPAVNTPTTQCTDIMSPSDCKLLFNACDPVICPSSRCNFGGEYPVRDVIQSGIIGSLALCLPNWNQGVYVPVCLTGVKAGVDNLISITDAYVGCLNTSLETGQTVGICDEIYSVYGCQLLWQQALPLLNLAVPRIDDLIFGSGNSRGGGEYLGGIQGAFQNVENSVEYITQYYAVGAFDAFKARSQGELGTAVCKNALSIAFPQGQGLLDALGQAQSPPQFTANFETIPFSSVTVPPQVQYKVFYHIFAGNDAGQYYQVYLKSSGSSFYRDTNLPRQVGAGYISVGESVDETRDFTGPEGYDQLCVQVGNQEECGFGKVSTDFALDYLSDQYIKHQAEMENIKTSEECISGTPNVMSLLNLNVQQGVTNTLSPDLQASGITRVCATENPGSESDPNYNTENQRWVKVGYCGNQNVGCWIDKQSIPGAVNFKVTADQTLESLNEVLKNAIINQSGLLTEEQFDEILSKILGEENPKERISLIEQIYDKVFGNNKKGYLLLLEGNAYFELATGLFNRLVEEGKLNQAEETSGKVVETELQNWLNEIDEINQNTGVEYPIFELKSGGILGLFKNSIYYSFYKGEWRFTDRSPEEKKWYSVNEAFLFTPPGEEKPVPFWLLEPTQKAAIWEEYYVAVPDKTAVSGINDPIPFWLQEKTLPDWNELLKSETAAPDATRVASSQKILDTEELSFIKGLEGKNYEEGVSFLVDRVTRNEEGGILSNAELSTESVSFSYDKIFTVSNLLKDGGEVVFEFDDSARKWGYKKGSGFLGLGGSNTLPIQDYTDEMSSLVSLLDGKDFYEGGVLIFGVDRKGGAVVSTQIPQSCSQYYNDIKSISQEKGVDPYLVLAVMIQESDCQNVAGKNASGKEVSFGLMQINTNFRNSNGLNLGWCGFHGLPSERGLCENILLNDPVKNIRVGTQILIDYKKRGSVVFNGCDVKDKAYDGWQAALRRYNGLGCENDQYVEQVVDSWGQLRASNVLESVQVSMSTSGEKIAETARSYIGKDTYRFESGGIEYSYVCATFVSNVLVAANALPEYTSCDPAAVPELQSVRNLNNNVLPQNDFNEVYNYKKSSNTINVRTGLIPGDVVLWGCLGSNCRSDEFQHATIFDRYDSTNNRYILIGDPGQARVIQEQSYTIGSTTWYPTYVWRIA